MSQIKEILKNNKFVDVPLTDEVKQLLNNQAASYGYYARGSGQATHELSWVENEHRQWVSEIIDLSDFPHCYFTNGTTDAIHHWRMTETRPWQKFEGEYQYMDMIGSEGKVCCDVPGQYMKDGRSAIPAVIDKDKPLYISIPSAADGNFFNPQKRGPIEAPVILDCTYIGATDIQKIDVPKNTEQVFFSFSKGFGMVCQRLGLVYTKEPHPTLERLKSVECWNYNGVQLISQIIGVIPVDGMWKKYREKQLEVCKEYDLTPSDCYFLATTKDPYYKERRRMKWNDNARICITPLLGNL